MLPSAFSTVEKQEDGTYLLSGGGYGHGLGMSQNGANGMAKAGMGYQDILNYFIRILPWKQSERWKEKRHYDLEDYRKCDVVYGKM